MIYDSPLWLEDIETEIAMLPELQMLSGKRILITGISGLIGSAVADILIRYNEMQMGGIEILAAGRSENKMQERFGVYSARGYFHYVKYDAMDPNVSIPTGADYIVHGAGNAYPALISSQPVETMESNFTGTLALLKYARDNKSDRILYISSSEVYGNKSDDQPFDENAYGYVDVLKPRNSYAMVKRATETLCSAFSDEYGVNMVIVRPGHVYGPTASAQDNRVSSEWAYSSAQGRDIVMKSNGEQIRSYCYCLDCASAILKVLLTGESGQAYNISNPESVISIRDLAERLARSAGTQVRMELPTETERKGFNPMNHSSLQSDKLMALGWKGCFDAETGLDHTVRIIRAGVLKK